MLILRETVEREVEYNVPCPHCWKYEDGACEECSGVGIESHRTVVYQVEAEVLLHTYKDKSLHSGIAICFSSPNEAVKSPKGCQFHHEVVQGFAEALLTAFLAGEDLPGVTVTEVLTGRMKRMNTHVRDMVSVWRSQAMTNHIPDTTKKVEPMTLDEPIDEFKRFANDLENGGHHIAAQKVDWCRDYLVRNRPALEAGVRGVLRFEINKTGDMCLLDLQGDPWILPGYTRDDVIEMAQSLNLTAKFEPAEPEESHD